MEDHSLWPQVFSAGVPNDQIEIALDHLYGHGGAPTITSEHDYRAAKALYAAMDASVPPQDLHSPMARYVLTLGVRMTEWEARGNPTADSSA